MTDTWKEAQERSERRHRDLQDRILAIPGSQRILRKLTKASANQGKILSLLASAVDDIEFWHNPVRRRKTELESIANELEAVADHAQRISLDPSYYGSFWLKMLGMGRLENAKSPKELAPIHIFGLMRRYAKNCRDKAKALGNLIKDHAPRERRATVDNLLLEVWLRTGKYHDKEIASLLTNASEAVGRKREFTDYQIKKHRQRYVVPRIKAYRRSHPMTSPPDS